MKKYYAHTNPNVVVSILDRCEYCTYHEVRNGVVSCDKTPFDVASEYIRNGEWKEITPQQADLILQDAINRQSGKITIRECFTTIDIHMFSSGKVNEFRT